MSDLDGARIALYVGGSVAAYKAADVVTALRRGGAEVRVAMTEGATHFVTATTLRAVSGHPVQTSQWDAAGDDDHGMQHLSLSAWCEVQVCVAASASLLARLAAGLGGDAVTAAALASTAPLLVAPAMETAMWEHPATRANVATLRERGVRFVGPVEGRLASGRSGLGRMAEPDAIVEAVTGLLRGAGWLAGTRVVVTAGATREPIDPVRYISNRSSGKMGNALAGALLDAGAEVVLVTAAPAPAPQPRLTVVAVETAEEMHAAVRSALTGAQALFMAAAVADHRPASSAARKLRKGEIGASLALEPTVDILAALATDPVRSGRVVVGFAAETHDLVAGAEEKLERKRLDAIVANDVSGAGVGMGADDNAVTVIGRDGVIAEIPRAPKPQVARDIVAALRPLLLAR